MFEAIHSDRSSAPPAAIWALWADPERWPDWNEQLDTAELSGPLAVGTEAVIKFKRGGRMHFKVVALEAGRLLTDEAKFPGCRFGHEHLVEPDGTGSRITHRLYFAGFTSGFFSRMLGRKRMEESVVGFVERERKLAE